MTNENRTLKVAILQHSATLNGVEERFAWLATKARDLKNQNVDLILCPECYATGYNVREGIVRNAQRADGDFATRVKALAKEINAAIAYGYPELDGGKVYNSAICIGPDGFTLANHRKSVLPPGFEKQYFETGSQLTLFTLNSVRVAVLICYESEFPEAVRNVAKLGAEVVIVPTATVRQYKHVPEQVIPARAFENGVFIVYANHAGLENESDYAGNSCVINPFGQDLARVGDREEVVIATLELDAVKAAQIRIPYLHDSEQIPQS